MMQKRRDAFSMLTAIFVIVLMSGVAAFVMGLGGKITQETVEQYQKEQAVLLAKSYTEYAIMAVMSVPNSTACVEDIDGKIGASNAFKDGKGYLIETRISFIGQDISNCSDTRELGRPITNDLNLIVDVYVKYKDINHPSLSATIADTPWITYHRRTLQKI